MDADNEINKAAKPPAPRRRPRPSEGKERLELMERINKMYNWERYAHITVSVLAAGLVLTNAVMMVSKGSGDASSLSLLFGSGGLIAVSVSRLIYMWNKTIGIIFGQDALKGEDDGR